MKHKTFLSCFLAILFCIPSAEVVSAQKVDIVRVEGRVFARSVTIADLVELQNVENQQSFFVEITKYDGEGVSPKIIKVRNTFSSKRDRLPNHFFTTRMPWALDLRRDTTCDQDVGNWNDRKSIVLLEQANVPKEGMFVECFDLVAKRKLEKSANKS